VYNNEHSNDHKAVNTNVCTTVNIVTIIRAVDTTVCTTMNITTIIKQWIRICVQQ